MTEDEKIDWWTRWFDARFGHNDYLRLNRKWKEHYFKQCAKEVVLAMDIIQNGPTGLSEKLTYMILKAVKTMGTFDPDKCLVVVDEDMNDEEYTKASMFLRWCHVNNRTFGRGNIHQVYGECKAALKIK